MESPTETNGSHSGLTPLMSSILELTREIENLDDEPLVREPRKVLWAKKRFPRQGIRCPGKTRAKRWKYIGATAKDFPSCILNKSHSAGLLPLSPVPAQVEEAFQREGSAGTRHETESFTSDPDRSGRHRGRDEQAPYGNRDDAENLSTNNNDDNVSLAGGFKIGDKIHPAILDNRKVNLLIADSNTWISDMNSLDDDERSHRAINVGVGGGDEDSSVYSSYSNRNDEISVIYHADSTVSYQEAIHYDVETENFDHVNTGFELSDGNNNFVPERNEINLRCSKRKSGKVRSTKRKKEAVCGDVAVAGPSSLDLGSDIRRACVRTRGKLGKTRRSEVCQGGERCFACEDPHTTKREASVNVSNRPSSSSALLTESEVWSKKEWDDFFCLFSAVAAEAHTLQTLGSDNMLANERWLKCMRMLLQRPPL